MDFRLLSMVVSLIMVAGSASAQDSDPLFLPAHLLPPSYGLRWNNYAVPMYNSEKRSLNEKMKSLKGKYNGQIRDILFG
uniref:Secreted protein n=1 Tax=Heterorhabditis bacteriophora TaxID=37862 RepID=A0A1I7XM29_HETBA